MFCPAFKSCLLIGNCSSINNFISGNIAEYCLARLLNTINEKALMATASVGDSTYRKQILITSP